MKSVLIKETMKEIKGNIIGGKLLLNFGAKIKFHIGSRVQNCYNRDLKIRGRRRQRKRRWKSEIAFFQSSSRLIQVTNFVK